MNNSSKKTGVILPFPSSEGRSTACDDDKLNEPSSTLPPAGISQFLPEKTAEAIQTYGAFAEPNLKHQLKLRMDGWSKELRETVMDLSVEKCRHIQTSNNIERLIVMHWVGDWIEEKIMSLSDASTHYPSTFQVSK